MSIDEAELVALRQEYAEVVRIKLEKAAARAKELEEESDDEIVFSDEEDD